jgi:hypothetical protein
LAYPALPTNTYVDTYHRRRILDVGPPSDRVTRRLASVSELSVVPVVGSMGKASDE